MSYRTITSYSTCSWRGKKKTNDSYRKCQFSRSRLLVGCDALKIDPPVTSSAAIHPDIYMLTQAPVATDRDELIACRKDGGRAGGREDGREGRREGGREGEREGGRDRGRGEIVELP
jgi:hypothetical protein